uniref:Pentacotripeptide-repeat region of PRORP domain-containing protein n=1 Tax=Aegilops tauschii subsp. strangulata TaxID=200361 RepID=A0A453FSU4_AEGTS
PADLLRQGCAPFHAAAAAAHARGLVALLLRHQAERRPLLQIHAQLVARQVFDRRPTPWHALLKAYSRGPLPQEALSLFRDARRHAADDTYAFVHALGACAALAWPRAAAQLHGLAVRKGFEFHAYVHTALVNAYVVCGCLAESRGAFDEMPAKNAVTWNVMITGFAARGEVEYARLLFERMPCRNIVSWTGMIDGYTRSCRSVEAVALFRRMMAEGIDPSEITVLAVVPAVSNIGRILLGETLHGYCEKKGLLVLDIRVGNSLIDLYAKIGSIKNSLKIFHEMLDGRNLVSWTSIISGFAMHGLSTEAVELFAEMRRAGIRPDRVTFLSVLSACNHGGLVEQGVLFFKTMVYEYSLTPEIKHFGCIIDMLGRAGRLYEAEQVISGLPMEVNSVIWRTLLGCCSKYGEVEMAERAMKKILDIERESGGDFVVVSNMLTEHGRFSDAERARKLVDEMNTVKEAEVIVMMETIKKLHGHLIVSGLHNCQYAMSKILRFYAILQPDLVLAHKVYGQIEAPTTYLRNIILRGLAQSDAPEDAIAFYKKARGKCMEPDNLTFPFVVKACARIGALKEGKQMHNHVLKFGLLSDIFVSNSLIHLYAACGDLCCARSVFDEMLVKDVVSWNSLICGYSRRNRLKEVLKLFKLMHDEGVRADKVTMAKVVSACTRLGDWSMADCLVKYIEDYCIEVDVYLGNTLIDYYGRRGQLQSAEKIFFNMKDRDTVTMNAMITAYAKAGDLVSARRLFEEISGKDLISWSSMISGYSQASQFSDALELFREMQRAKVKPDAVVLASVLSACAHLGALDLGKWIHDYMRRHGIEADTILHNSLIDMYAKCGSTKEALQVFREMKEKDTLSWNSIIMGMANNGAEEEALSAFHAMIAEGFRPNEVTFLGVLIACANAELVEEGLGHFESMRSVHGVEPQMKHYGVVVDLLGRAGRLTKALRFVAEMPVAPELVVYRILLGAARTHGDLGVAEVVAERLRELDGGNSGDYTLMSNAYAGADRWSDAMEVRQRMEDSRVRKLPACSVVDC